MSMKRYICEKCYWRFLLEMQSADDYPKYCPNCGKAWEYKKTPIEIVEEIKSIYHSLHKDYRTIRDEVTSHEVEEKMEKLLYELKEMAEGNK